jgi:hypothetical protein
MLQRLEYVAVESRDTPGEWRTEAIDTEGDGAVYVTLFAGPDSRERAEEYANWKNAWQRAGVAASSR